MKEKALLVGNVILFLFAALVLVATQTSLWLQIFGYAPPPALWIPALVYIALFRSTLMLIIVSHLMAIALSSATAMPEGLLMVSCLSVALGIQFFKARFFWTATTYFMLVSGIAVLLFHCVHFLASWVVGDHPVTSPEISDWIIQALLTPLFAPALFPVFRWFDSITQQSESAEIAGTMST